MEAPRSSSQSSRTVHRIEIAVDWPPGHVAAYLIDGPEPILVDAGMAGDDAADELAAGLAAADRTFGDIEHLVVTHPHIDHIGQVPALLDAGDPTVYAPVGARERLSRSSESLATAVRKNGRKAGLSGDVLDTIVDQSVNSLERNRALLEPETVDRWIADGEEFVIDGMELTAIHTPGHQADHLCYDTTIDGIPTLLSGDILLEPFRSVMIHTGLDDGVEDGVSAFFHALDRLAALDTRRVFPGHGDTHDALDETIERSRDNIEQMLASARDTVEAGRTTVFELAKRRANERNFEYVLPEVYSALSYLESNGEISVTVEDGVRYYHAD